MRYIPITQTEKEEMLKVLGVASTEALFADISAELRLQRPLNLPEPQSELEIMRNLGKLAAKNADLARYPSFLGAGAYDHYIPSAVDHLLRRGEFLTAYTPYQAEISQGVLQVIYEYQSLVCELTGMDIANASMYDGASALAEGAIMALGATGRNRVLISKGVHPEYRETVKTYLSGLGAEVIEVELAEGVTDLALLQELADDQSAAFIVQQPNFYGCLEPVQELGQTIQGVGGLYLTVVDPISLGLLEAPGQYGADIVVAEGQALGNPLSYGGPYLGLLAAREAFSRRVPGRIAGATVDGEGRRGFVLTLQAREQHIRRERATSNICTNQALNALAATIYLSFMGKEGLRQVAYQSLQKAHYAAAQLTKAGYPLAYPKQSFFKEFAVVCDDPEQVNEALYQAGIIGGYPLEGKLLIAVTEKRTKAEIDQLAQVMAGVQR